MGYDRGGKSGPRELDDIEGLSPSGSSAMHPYKEEIMKENQEACMDEHG